MGGLPEDVACLDETDIDLAVSTAFAHRLTPWVCRRLLELQPPALAEETAAAAREFLDNCAEQTMPALRELDLIITELRRAGIVAVPFKGPTLSLLAFGSGMLRQFGDLDLFVAAADFPKTMEVLQAMNYRSLVNDLPEHLLREYWRYNGQDMLFRDDCHAVEPHSAPGPVSLRMPVDIVGMIARARPVEIAGMSFPCLTREDAAVLLVLQAVKDQWRAVSPALEFAGIVARAESFDWAAFLSRCSAAGLRRAARLTALLAHDLFCAPVEAKFLAEAQSDKVARRLTAGILESVSDEPVEDVSVFELTRFRWLVRERWSDRLGWALRTLLIARVPHFRSVALPPALMPLYPLVRLGHDFVALPLWLFSKRFQ